MQSLGTTITLEAQRRALYASIAASALVFALGWGTMRALWEYHGSSYDGSHTFPYYLSAYWGDSILLPAITGLSVYELLISAKTIRWRVTLASAAPGFIAGIMSQFSWTHSDTTILNWTFNDNGTFNTAGWYHALFLCMMCSIFTAAGASLILIQRRRQTWFRASAIRYLTIGYLSLLFTCLLSTDNQRESWRYSISFTPFIKTVCIPITISVLIIVVAKYLRASRRVTLAYALTLVVTSAFVPSSLLCRGLDALQLITFEGMTVTAATVFAALFVTSRSSSTLTEQLIRSLPTAVCSMSFSLALPFIYARGGTTFWTYLLAALVTISLCSVTVCRYDCDRAEAFYTFISALLLVSICAMSSAIRLEPTLQQGPLTVVFPAVIIIIGGGWVRQNASVVLVLDGASSSDPLFNGASDEREAQNNLRLSQEKVLRGKVLFGFVGLAASAMIIFTWSLMGQGLGSTATIVHSRHNAATVTLCAIQTAAMTFGSFWFSYLSFRDNLYELPNFPSDRTAKTRNIASAAAVAVFSLPYGIFLSFSTHDRSNLAFWFLPSVLYMIALILVYCYVIARAPKHGLFTFTPFRRASDSIWPLRIRPAYGVAQDLFVSLVPFNTLGIGIPMWILGTGRPFPHAWFVLAGIMVPLGSMFLFYLNNNLKHPMSQQQRLAGDVARDASRYSQHEADRFISALKRHCLQQNRAMALTAAFALLAFFVTEIVGSALRMESSDGITQFLRIVGSPSLTVFPQLTDTLA